MEQATGSPVQPHRRQEAWPGDGDQVPWWPELAALAERPGPPL